MARWKTLPYAYRCPVTNMIVKVMDLSREQASKVRKFFSKGTRSMQECKPKQHKHS